MGVLGESVSSGLATGLEAFWGTRENQRILHVEAVRLEIVRVDSEKGVFLADFAEVGLDRFW
jgi:hypothetical protein